MCVEVGESSSQISLIEDADVMQIHGDMDKHEKFAFIRLFTEANQMKGFKQGYWYPLRLPIRELN